MNLDVKEKGDLTLYEILIEMSHRGIELLPVDIYKSEASLFLVEDGKNKASACCRGRAWGISRQK